MASLGFEVVLIRIFTVTMGYHFTYMVISMALLGYGSAGAFLTIRRDFLKKNAWKHIVYACILFSLSILLSYIAANQVRFDLVNLSWDPTQIVYILVTFIILSIPFFFSGLIISGTIRMMSDLVGKLYFADLGGAAVGCFLPSLLFPLFSRGETVIVVFSLLGLLSSIVFYFSQHPLSSGILHVSFKIAVVAAFTSVLFFITPSILDMRISPYRDIMQVLRYENARIIETIWGPSFRMDIIDSPAVRYAPGLSLKYLEPLPYQTGITIDGGNLQAVTSPQIGEMDFLNYLPSSLPYKLKNKTNDDFEVLVIDSGGGLEMLSALYSGASKVTGTEENPELARYVREIYSNSKSFQDFGSMVIYTEDGRRFLKNAKKKFDIIQLPLTNVSGASSSTFSSGENYNLTIEAFREYYHYLKDDGYLSVTSYLRPILVEEARLMSIIMESIGEPADPHESLALIRSWGTITFLVKKGNLEEKEINGIREFCKELNFDLVYFPGIKKEETNIYNRFSEPIYHNLVLNMLDTESRKRITADYLFDISPVSDDSPFFYNFIRLNRLTETYESTDGKWTMILEGGFIPPLITVQALILSFILIILPHYWRRSRNATEILRRKGKNNITLRFLGYFILIGIAYMFIEISLLHRFSILFSNMSYSVSLVLSILLIASGLGSLLASGMIAKRKNYIFVLSASVAVLLLIYSFFIGSLLDFLMGVSPFARIVAVAGLLFPIGFLMGTFFPAGMFLAGKIDKRLVTWLWCANGTASVVGAPLSVSIAVYSGFSLVLVTAGFFYLIASFLIYPLLKKQV